MDLTLVSLLVYIVISIKRVVSHLDQNSCRPISTSTTLFILQLVFLDPFLAKRCNPIEKFGCCHDTLSVHLSVVRVYCGKTTEYRITRFSLKVAKCLNF